MSRPVSNTVDFFPHKIGSGKKMFFIEQKYGNDGYAIWFKILEKISSTENHYLNLNEEEELMYLSAKCHVSEERLLNVVNDISRIGGFDKNLWQKKILWSEKFYQEIQAAYKRRNSKCMDYDSLCKHLKGLCILNDDSNPQSRVEYSRVEESKDSIVGQDVPATTDDAFSPKKKCQLFVEAFNKIKMNKNGRVSKYLATDQVCSALNARLKKYSSKDLMTVIKRALRDEYHIETGYRYLTPAYILRQDIVERFLNQ